MNKQELRALLDETSVEAGSVPTGTRVWKEDQVRYLVLQAEKDQERELELIAKAVQLLREGAEPDATQEAADRGMCAQWDVDAVALASELEALLMASTADQKR